MSQIYNFDPSLSYLERTQVLTNNSVAVWDVLFDCERPGSLDSAIVKESVRVNNFSDFFSQHSELRTVVFNGAAAETFFKRHYGDLLTNSSSGITWHRCPSTSPAHASISTQAKLEAWHQALQ